MSQRFRLQAALVLLAGLACVGKTQEALAGEPFKNPFASSQQAPPGWFVANLHAGSFHENGIGVSAGVVPIRYLELKGSYAYRYERSLAAYAKVNILPMALLSPYVSTGYVRAGVKFDKGLSVAADSWFAALGLQARFLDHYFIGVEAAGLYVLQHSVTLDGATVLLGASDRFDVLIGFQTGVYFP